MQEFRKGGDSLPGKRSLWPDIGKGVMRNKAGRYILQGERTRWSQDVWTNGGGRTRLAQKRGQQKALIHHPLKKGGQLGGGGK